jgi:hypothetical protein
MSNKILMQKGVAIWLIRKTLLTDEQIADFCKIHRMEVDFLRNHPSDLKPCNPIDACLITEEEIMRCEKDQDAELEALEQNTLKQKKTRVNAKKHELDSAVLWLVNHYPDFETSFYSKLVGCTPSLVKSIKSQSYADLDTLVPKHPVGLSLCTQQEFDAAVLKAEIKKKNSAN